MNVFVSSVLKNKCVILVPSFSPSSIMVFLSWIVLFSTSFYLWRSSPQKNLSIVFFTRSTFLKKSRIPVKLQKWVLALKNSRPKLKSCTFRKKCAAFRHPSFVSKAAKTASFQSRFTFFTYLFSR